MIPPRDARRIRLAVGLSLLAHAALLLIPMRPPDKPSSASSEVRGPMTVQIMPRAPQKSAPQASPPQPRPEVQPRPEPPRPPVVAGTKPTPDAPRVPMPPRPGPREPSPPVDMASLVEARRARRMASRALGPGPDQNPPPPEDKSQLALNRNIQSLQRGEGGPGGVFQILRMGPRTAEFAFNGWRPNASRGWREVIEVDAGAGGNVELAVIRRMIALIRTHYQGDFNWESHRMGRVIVLSARPEDTAGLEDFLYREFFGTPVLNTPR